MKYILLPAFALLFLSCQGNLKEKPKPKHSETDWAFYNLNDDVKNVKTRSVKISNGSKEQGNELSSELDSDQTFDDYGNLITETKWAKKDILFEKAIFEGRNKLINKTQYTQGKPAIITENQWDAAKENLMISKRKNTDGSQIDRIAYILDNGKPREKITFGNQDYVSEKVTYIYDNKGNLKTESLLPDGANAKYKVVYEYDSDNNKISESRYTTEKNLSKTSYVYKGKNLVEKRIFDGNGTPSYSEAMVYDNKDNIISHSTEENKTGIKTLETFSYDNNGNLISWTTEATDEPQVTIKNTYDTYNSLTSTTTLQGNNLIEERTFSYEYDSHKNWIKKTINIKNGPSFKVTREVTYY